MIDTDIDIDMHILHTHVLRLVSCESTVAHAGIVLFWKTVPMGLQLIHQLERNTS